MKKLLFGFLAVFTLCLFTLVAEGVAPTNQVINSNGQHELDKWMGPVALRNYMGTKLRQAHNVAYGKYDFSLVGGALATNLGVGIVLPDNAIITNVWFDTITTPTSTSDTDICFTAVSACDLEPYTAKASWSGQTQGTPDDSVTNAIKLAADTTVYFVASGASVTAGKIMVYIQYVMSE